MRRNAAFPVSLVLAVAVVFAFAAVAEEKTVSLEGSVVCAKCTLKEKDRTACQNVLQVKSDKGETQNYYIAKNDIADKFGDVCTAMKTVTITGVVTEKDGLKWIEAQKIEEMKKS